MKAEPPWSELGWKHPLWDLVRYYLSIRGTTKQATFRQTLLDKSRVVVDEDNAFPVSPEIIELFQRYLEHRERMFVALFGLLRTEDEALAFCGTLKVLVKQTQTQQEHHQSSKAVVAAVSALAEACCKSCVVTVNSNPQTRCMWCNENGLHVSARNIDGAIPSLMNPRIIWEIKEYWGKTSGGSKMSDAVYECHLVGLELRYFEEKTKCKVEHIVFVDGKEQWTARKSDLNRFIDLLNQGLIDQLFVGKDIEGKWSEALRELLKHD